MSSLEITSGNIIENESKLLSPTAPSVNSSIINYIKKKKMKEDLEPFIEQTYQNLPIICFYCQLEFENLIKAETHQFLHHHFGQPNNKYWKQKIWVFCRKCGMEIVFNIHKDTHKCFDSIEKSLLAIYDFVNKAGIPLYCMLCNVRPLKSRTHLIIHLIAFHSDNFDSYYCSICHCQFRSNRPYVKEEHMKEEHGGDMEINFLRKYRIKEGKHMSLAHFLNPLLCTFKIGKHKICGILFKNLALFTIHVLCYHCPKKLSRLQSIMNFKKEASYLSNIECHKCEILFDDVKSLDLHIEEFHQPDFERQLNYHIRRGNFKMKHNPKNTCLLCAEVFPDQLSKQVHNYVRHWSNNWRQCGLCHEEIILESDLDLSDNLQFKFIQVHETLHIKAIHNLEILKENKSELLEDYNLSLMKKPELYIGTYIPIHITEQEERQRKIRKRIFSKETKRYFVNLGKINRTYQEALEIFG